MHCTICDLDVHPYQDMQPDGRMLDLCPKCNAPIAKAPSVVVTGANTTHKQALSDLQAAIADAKARVARVATPSAPADPVTVLRARLSAVEERIPTPDQLKALRTERDQLRRALRALGVDPAPKPN